MTDLQNTINKSGILSGKARTIGIAAALIIGGPWLVSNSVEMLDSTEIMVIQYPNGTLLAAVEPGWYGQWFGSVTKYPLRSQFSFSSALDQGAPKNESLKLRFNDGGHANVSGVVSWEMPVDHDHLIMIHRKFGNTKSVEQQIIRPTLESAAYTSGPLMSSTESAAEKRNLLLQYMQDQAKNGTYQTRTVTLKVPDPLTGVEKTVNAAEIVMAAGIPVREQESATKVFGINLLPMTINQIKYDDAIESQITQRQVSIQGVQIAQANALKAEQDAITAEKLGQAEAAKAKWTQEAIKAQKITEAQQFLEVATLEAKQAEQYKNKQILEGQGNAEKKRLEMQANGALDQKLDAYVSIQKAYAQAIGAYKGAWVPQIVTGGVGSAAGSGAQQMIDLLSVKAAKDLGINMSIEGAAQTTGKQ